MKRLIALILVCALLAGCTPQVNTDNSTDATTSTTQPQQYTIQEIVPEFANLDDVGLLTYVEDQVYTNLVHELDNEAYFVENVSAVYISKEYLEEVAYNSQENIYFGFTLSELDAVFEGTRYVFTLGEDGQTVVTEFQKYDDTYEQILKNIAIGTGVILVCVTVSVVTAGAGAPAVSLIFAASAKTGTVMALSSGLFSGVTAGVVTGIETGDFDEAMKAAALAGSDGFKWGAFSGVIAGGATETVKYANAMKALKGVSLNGLTTQQAAAIQMETGYPVSIIKQFHSMDEFMVYKNAGLQSQMVGGQLALVKDIDLNFKSDLAGTQVTNLERMRLGYAPIDPATGKAYQLHHIGQKSNADTRPEVAAAYSDAEAHLTDVVSDGEGVESVRLSKEDDLEMARRVKQDEFDPEDFGVSADSAIKAEYILKKAMRAGATAAAITVAIQMAPEIYKAIDYLIKTGQINVQHLKKMGTKAVTAGAEGFLRGSISCTVLIMCEKGLLGEAFKGADPTIVGTIVAVVLETVKNSIKVAAGMMTAREMGAAFTDSVIVSAGYVAGAKIGGIIGQALGFELPVIGYMIGSLVGCAFAAVYNIGKNKLISFCVDTGFTCFGLVEQNYELPEEVLAQMGVETITIPRTEVPRTAVKTTAVPTINVARTEHETIGFALVRRGVIGVNKIGYVV